MIKGILISFFWVSVWILAQILYFHLFKPEKKFLIFTFLFTLTIPLYFATYALTPPDLSVLPAWAAQSSPGLGILNGMLLHGLLYCTYAEMFYYVCRPVTLRLLSEFLRTPDASLSLAELQKGYSLKEMIHSRLETMVLNGYLIREKDCVFRLTPKGTRFARLFLFIRRFLGVPYYIEGL